MSDLTEEEAQQRIAALEVRLKALQSKAAQLPLGIVPETTAARTARETAAGTIPEPAGDGGVWDTIKGTLGNIKGQDVSNALQEAASGATFGLTDKAADYLGMDSPERRDARRAENPMASRIAQGSGALLSAVGGPLKYLGKAGQGLLGMAESRVPALASNVVGRTAGQAAVGAATGAVGGGVQAATQGGDVLEGAGKGALTGGAVGGGMQALAEGAGGIARGLANTSAGKAADILKPPPPPNGAPQPTAATADTVLAPQPPAAGVPAPSPGAPPAGNIQAFMAQQQAEQVAAAQAQQAAQQEAAQQAQEQARQQLAFKGPGLDVGGHGPLGQALGLLPGAGIAYGMMTHPGATLGAAGLAMAARNAGPIAGRVLLPAARAGANALQPAAAGMSPLAGSIPGIEEDVALAKERVRKKKKSPRNE